MFIGKNIKNTEKCFDEQYKLQYIKVKVGKNRSFTEVNKDDFNI